MEIVFSNPNYLWFLLSIAFLILVHFYTLKHMRRKALKFANFDAIARVTGKEVLSKNVSLLAVRIFALLFAVLAISGTVVIYTGQTSNFNVILAIDASSSMTATDINPTRLQAAKEEAVNFINSIKTKTKVGVVSFSGASFIEQELTDDFAKVKESIDNVDIKTIGGTDLGEAIITSVNMLLTEPKARMIILLTDGQSNVGVSLEEAVNYANEKFAAIYTIGMGTEEGAEFAGLTAVSRLDEESLKLIAFNTGAEYFKTENRKELSDAYQKIIETTTRKLSLNITPLLMLLSILLLFIEWALLSTRYRMLP